MFITVKKRILIALLVAIATLSIIITASFVGETQAAGGGKVVVIDAGHGGEDGGVVGSTTGTKESDINLAIAKKLKTVLEEGGYKVVMTRESDISLSYPQSGSKKLADMKKRKQIILDAQPDLVVSIHQNYYPSSYVKGAQVFYAPSGEHKQTAEILQKLLNRSLDCSRNAAKGDYYIIQCSPYTSVLVECGFLSNPEEEALLVTSEYQQKVAYAIYSGINFILGSPLIS
ncbi:MAG: N-acetylmuramoyl-L-alanine amidase [Clostridia bacterium]|nr:N-acetylmuramoyl-L-alanine amidase [Clostridia bacterium]